MVANGCNSPIQAINLAYHFGAKRIIMLGLDLAGNTRYGNRKYPAPMVNDVDYGSYIPFYEKLNPPVEVINCSPKTALRCFPVMPFKDALDLIY